MKQTLARALFTLWRLVPEGPARNALRRALYRVRVGIPRELLINPGDTVVQVGMWRLSSLRRAARAVGPSGRLLLIEASPEHAARAAEFLADKGMDNCSVVNAAGWHESGTLELNLSDDPSGIQVDGVHADIPHEVSGRTVSVPAVRLDDVTREHGITAVDYLEVTVNGAELQVLQGAPDLLPHVRRLLAAGMMRDPETHAPLNERVAEHLAAQGFRTTISRHGRVANQAWGRIDGHVYASR